MYMEYVEFVVDVICYSVMFWTDWNRESPKIEKANMDGTDRQSVVTQGLSLPNGLAIDYHSSQVCWADAGKPSHTRTVVRECCKGDDASQWRSPKFDPHHAETPYANAGVIKLAEVITSWTPTPVQKFVTIRQGVSFPRMRDFAHQIAHQKVLVFFGGAGVLAIRYSQGPWTDFDAKYAKTRGSAQGCAFSGSRTKNLISRPQFSRISAILGTIFDRTWKIFA